MRSASSVITVFTIVALCSAAPLAVAGQERDRGNRERNEAASKSVSRDRSNDQKPNRETQAPAQSSRRTESTTTGPRDSGPRDFGSRTSAPPVTLPRDFGTRSNGPRESGSRENGPTTPITRDFGSRGGSRGGNETVGNAPTRTPGNNSPTRDFNANRGTGGDRQGYTERDGNRALDRGREVWRDRGNERGNDRGRYESRNWFGSRSNYGFRGYYRYEDSYWYRGSWSHRAYYRPLPYYSYRWRPYLSVGFGIWVGYPMLFPDECYYYSRPTTYASYGALSFDMTPAEAYVFVDGNYVGTARDFSPYMQPLTLSVGMHQIAIDAPGYRSVEFAVQVLAGQLIPYRGQLEYDGRY